MRCPKCHYISFEAGDRCRNCGYDFSFTAPVTPDPALPLRDRDGVPLPPMDLSLSQVERLGDPLAADHDAAFDVARPGRTTPFDLPLFGGTVSDAPLVKAPAIPRAPLAVRRATPDAQRSRGRHPVAELPGFDLGTEPAGSTPDRESDLPNGETLSPMPAPALRRLAAAVLDVMVLTGINVSVLYFTLKLCALPLTLAGLLAVPLMPLIIFLVLLDVGYVVTFTAVMGQTIGKMAAGLKVVHVGENDGQADAPNLGFAFLRTAAYAASLLPAGLGFVPALFGRDRRALHDRLAETKVIKI